MDLSKYTLKQLEKLAKDVEKAIDRAKSKQVKEAKKALEAVAKEHGVDLADLISSDPKPVKRKKRATKPSKPMYKNPKDAKQTWSGRGRQPAWFKQAVASGTNPDKLKI